MRELYSYFVSPAAYIIIVVFLLLSSWFFTSTVFLIGEVTLEGFLNNIPMLFAFLLPAVAMKLISEEFKEGTIEIISTQPAREDEIILGKYGASLTLLALILVGTLVHPVTLSTLGKLDWGQTLGIYLGLFLLGASYLMIGLFASALSKAQVVSFIIGFVICFIFFILGKVLNLFPPFIGNVLNFLGSDSHFENITKGIIDTRDIFYYASFLYLFFIFTLRVLQRKRGVRFSLPDTAVLVGIAILVNYLAHQVFFRTDLTSSGMYSLSQPSRGTVRKIDEAIYIKIFFNRNLPPNYASVGKYLKDLLQEYKSYAPGKIKLEFLDPSENEEVRTQARQAGIYPVQFTEIKADKYEVKEGYMGLVLYYRDNKETVPFIKETSGLEYLLTSRIGRLLDPSRKRVGYIGEEGSLSDLLISKINENHLFEPVTFDKERLDKEIDALLVMGGKREWNDEELLYLDVLLSSGIPVGILLDRYSVPLDNFSGSENKSKLADSFLKKYGVAAKNGLVCEPFPFCQRIGVAQRRGFFMIQNIV